ncbi:uncharacterized protein LOC122713247 isoform X2 [Apis laboriosa]|uniref:uncharacterized protein LOC122713247 isoform X2 n=1 Tax=Apis laboriosa TaxID=183418 RepID=UPI001CC5F1CE|nr:uncharacterized protein LOC122713247 isoform X2 [Apis laboriosa]
MFPLGAVVIVCSFVWRSESILLYPNNSLFQLEPTIMLAREARDLNLQDAYEAIENLLDRHGWEDGRECLLKTICELAETPFARTRRDVLEEVIHLILTRSKEEIRGDDVYSDEGGLEIVVAVPRDSGTDPGEREGGSSREEAGLVSTAPRLSSRWCFEGFAMPVQVSGQILSYGQNIQFQYMLPNNATFFTNYFQDASRRRRRASWSERVPVYDILQRELDMRNVDGKACLKKNICEAASTSLKDEGLVGELLHLLLTPDEGDAFTMDYEYIEAATFGRRGNNCSMIYSTCPPGQGILDRISTIY